MFYSSNLFYNEIKPGKNTGSAYLGFIRIKRNIFLIFILSLFLIINPKAQNNSSERTSGFTDGSRLSVSAAGDISVTKWPDGRKSAFSFTFDDGYMSQYTYAWPILNSYGFKGTFYLIANSLTDGPPGIYRYGYWSQFSELAAAGNEIGDHTMTHPDLTTLPVGNDSTPGTLTYELVRSKQIIEQKIPGSKLLTLAYPMGSYNPQVEDVARQYYQAARAVGGYTGSSTISGNNWYSLLAGNIVFSQTRSAADDQAKLNSYLDILQNQTIPGGKWSIFLAHEVVPADSIYSGSVSDYYPVSTEWLNSLCQWLKQKSDTKDMWIATVADVMKYIKERESFYYSPVASGGSEIDLIPLDSLDNNIYDYPLTLDITVPSGWNNVTVKQGTHTVNLAATLNNGVNTIRTDIIPGGGTVRVINSDGLYTVSGEINYDNVSATPVPDVTVILKSQADSAVAYSGAGGKFSFADVAPGNYTLTAFKTGNNRAVNSTDALSVAKYFASPQSLDSLQFKAADVNNDGSVDNKDALLIAERYVNLITSFSRKDWIFSSPVNITVTDRNVSLMLKCIQAGDINKSYR